MEAPNLREALKSIAQYGSDTLSGPVGRPDDRAWHREGVAEMTRRARAALKAVPATPDPAEVLATYYVAERSEGGTTDEVITRGLMAVLARYGTPAPVPVAERLPEEGDCAPWPDDPDTQHWCWAGVIVDGGWEWHQRSPGIFTFIRDAYTHWLPHWALPLPEARP